MSLRSYRFFHAAKVLQVLLLILGTSFFLDRVCPLVVLRPRVFFNEWRLVTVSEPSSLLWLGSRYSWARNCLIEGLRFRRFRPWGHAGAKLLTPVSKYLGRFWWRNLCWENVEFSLEYEVLWQKTFSDCLAQVHVVLLPWIRLIRARFIRPFGPVHHFPIWILFGAPRFFRVGDLSRGSGLIAKEASNACCIPLR